jgi:hypothetical protein
MLYVLPYRPSTRCGRDPGRHGTGQPSQSHSRLGVSSVSRPPAHYEHPDPGDLVMETENGGTAGGIQLAE